MKRLILILVCLSSFRIVQSMEDWNSDEGKLSSLAFLQSFEQKYCKPTSYIELKPNQILKFAQKQDKKYCLINNKWIEIFPMKSESDQKKDFEINLEPERKQSDLIFDVKESENSSEEILDQVIEDVEKRYVLFCGRLVDVHDPANSNWVKEQIANWPEELIDQLPLALKSTEFGKVKMLEIQVRQNDSQFKDCSVEYLLERCRNSFNLKRYPNFAKRVEEIISCQNQSDLCKLVDALSLEDLLYFYPELKSVLPVTKQMDLEDRILNFHSNYCTWHNWYTYFWSRPISNKTKEKLNDLAGQIFKRKEEIDRARDFIQSYRPDSIKEQKRLIKLYKKVKKDSDFLFRLQEANPIKDENVYHYLSKKYAEILDETNYKFIGVYKECYINKTPQMQDILLSIKRRLDKEQEINQHVKFIIEKDQYEIYHFLFQETEKIEAERKQFYEEREDQLGLNYQEVKDIANELHIGPEILTRKFDSIEQTNLHFQLIKKLKYSPKALILWEKPRKKLVESLTRLVIELNQQNRIGIAEYLLNTLEPVNLINFFTGASTEIVSTLSEFIKYKFYDFPKESAILAFTYFCPTYSIPVLLGRAVGEICQNFPQMKEDIYDLLKVISQDDDYKKFGQCLTRVGIDVVTATLLGKSIKNVFKIAKNKEIRSKYKDAFKKGIQDEHNIKRYAKFPNWSKLTNKEIRKIAQELGYSETKDYKFNSHGELVFKKGNKYISYDRDSHKGGFWKMYRKNVREGTYDIKLKVKLGE